MWEKREANVTQGRKQTFFRKMLATGGGGGGGGVDVMFRKTKVPKIFRKSGFRKSRKFHTLAQRFLKIP
jgi:hypothetical protein